MAKIIGLTGGSGSGKSALAGFWRELGGHIIDADAVYHRLLMENRDMVSELAAAFPLAAQNNAVDRRILGKIVFQDGDALERLGDITHKYVIRSIQKEIAGRRRARVLIVEAIYLIESGLGRLCGLTIAVTAPYGERLSRVMARDGLDEEAARLRLSRQKPDEFYIQNCDKVIRNHQGERELLQQAETIWEETLS